MQQKAGFKNIYSLQLQFYRLGHLFIIFGIVLILSITSGCKSPAELVEQADEDVHEILTEKWQDDFGEMVNYKIREEVATTEEIMSKIPESGVLSLAKAVEIATEYSRDYQSQKESLYNSALSLSLTRHNYARQWFGSFDATYRTSPESGGYEDGTNETKTLSASTGLTQSFITAGGVLINSGLTVDWQRFLTDDPYTTLGSVFTTTITAPLLGNVAGKQAWESLTQSERNMLYQIRSFNRYRQTFVVSIINSYYNVLQARESLEITRDSYARQEISTRRLKMEVEVGQGVQSDADRAEQSMLQAQNSLVNSEQSYAQTLDSFKVSLSLPTDANITLDPNELVALRDLGVSEPDYTLEEAIELALEMRLDLANTRDQLDDSKRSLILAADGIGVQAQVTAGMNVSSPSGETDFLNLQLLEGTYNAGLGVDLPFDQMSERNNYRRALISYQQSMRGYDREVENIKLAIRQSYRNLVQTAESYRIQVISVSLAEKQVQEQRLLLEFGRGTVETLLNAENSLVSTQNNMTNALISHLNAKLSFYRDIGVLSVRPDGMWEQRQL